MTQHQRTLHVGGATVTVRTSNRTTLGLDVTKAGDIIVRGPHHTTDTEAVALVERRRRWIYRQLNHLAETAPHTPVRHLVDGEQFTLLGRPHRFRIAPDGALTTPATRQEDPESGTAIHMRRSSCLNLDKARRELINLHAKTAQEWLKTYGPHITRYTNTPDMMLTASTRLRTTWVRHHPGRGLTLHWATAQLPTPLLRELLHRSLDLHTVADTHQLDRALRNLWLGDLTRHPLPITQPAPTGACSACSAAPGTLHADHCDIARCALTGRQRGTCHPANVCNTIWTGQYPGVAECAEYGFYYRHGPNGYEPCNADAPDAHHDLNRLYAECHWDIAAQRMVLPA
ncbi:YgjP-like metallopeptidase domain-containing protein [Streptomyces chrestomyceticus]|uniref:YgjP-like metallopeptidase domain-containing protein n=1 Tax=Streptomyces chrestomyceticus TaxID=68185 RepID=UPI00340EFA96